MPDWSQCPKKLQYAIDGGAFHARKRKRLNKLTNVDWHTTHEVIHQASLYKTLASCFDFVTLRSRPIGRGVQGQI